MGKVSPDRFDRVMLPHLNAAYNLARWLCGSPTEADDVVQEAYLRALRFFDDYRDDNPRAWLLTIVRNTWFSQWRHDRHEREDIAVAPYDETSVADDAALTGWSQDDGEDPERIVVRRQDVALVHQALRSLPVAFREVLVLRELEAMSYKEISVIVGVPVGTVMSRLARARQMLGIAVRAELQHADHRTTSGGAPMATGAQERYHEK